MDYVFCPKTYFNDLNFDENWFESANPIQIMNLINIEKDDLHSNKFNKRDCHTVLVFLRKKHRESIKRKKISNKNFKKKLGFITVNARSIQSNDCSICLETPSFNNLVKTNCKHYFCRMCYDKWVVSVLKNNFDISCPNCRKINPVIQQYKINKQ